MQETRSIHDSMNIPKIGLHFLNKTIKMIEHKQIMYKQLS